MYKIFPFSLFFLHLWFIRSINFLCNKQNEKIHLVPELWRCRKNKTDMPLDINPRYELVRLFCISSMNQLFSREATNTCTTWPCMSAAEIKPNWNPRPKRPGVSVMLLINPHSSATQSRPLGVSVLRYVENFIYPHIWKRLERASIVANFAGA